MAGSRTVPLLVENSGSNNPIIADDDAGVGDRVDAEIAVAAGGRGGNGRTGDGGRGDGGSDSDDGGRGTVIAELRRRGVTHIVCASEASRRVIWAELGLLKGSAAAGSGCWGTEEGTGAIEVVSESWLVKCLQEEVSFVSWVWIVFVIYRGVVSLAYLFFCTC